jgi:hypothetical protein
MKDESVKLFNKNPHRSKQRKRFIRPKDIAIIIFMVMLAIVICYLVNPKYPIVNESAGSAGFMDRIIAERVMRILQDRQYQEYLKEEYDAMKEHKYSPF